MVKSKQKSHKTDETEKELPKWLYRVVALEDVTLETSAEPTPLPDEAPLVPVPELEPEAEPAQPKRSRRKTYLISAAALLGVVVIGWAVCSIYLTQVLVSGVSIPAHASDKVLADTLQKRTAAYQLTIKYPDGNQKHYAFQKLGLTLDQPASLQATRQRQHTFTARLQWWRPVPASVVVKTDKIAFNNFIATKANVTVQPSQDAILKIVNGEIQITDATAGKQYGLAQPQQTILAAVNDLKQSVIQLKTLTVKPALTAQALEIYKPGLEKTLSQPISFSIGAKIVTPSPTDIANWLEITPDDKSKKSI